MTTILYASLAALPLLIAGYFAALGWATRPNEARAGRLSERR